MLHREEERGGETGNTPASQVSFHLRETGAETLLSSPILQNTTHRQGLGCRRGNDFLLTLRCQRQACFCQGDANKASPDTDNGQTLSLLARTGNTAQTV